MKKEYCTLYIVRHGETEWNQKGLIQGQSGDSPLTKLGEKQVQALMKTLSSVHFDAVYSSDLIRAKRTAEIIALERNLIVKATNILRERNFGRLEGKSREELKKFEASFLQLTEKERFAYKPFPDVESEEEVISRLFTFLREVAIVYTGKNVLIVTHGGMMRALLNHLGFIRYSDKAFNIIGNTAYIKLLSDGVEFFIKETKGIKMNGTRLGN